ncbi:type II toxin-antitoxin system HigB family toxin [Pedobacter kyonggii]|uniref:Type II toxin-antitoxin system HigB family toxin n=1 Tax=Pedobacter kyonggii TaxID=1926871 RepID=A0A4Q9HAS3_9SPHI|nr:type II toxin-antitoxin system HigB family toxin [Pedobacter kyonggii]TBO41192.1 type II toxin-antitoxin system HigB family toxin [Pedobacter kyonggii]
MRLTGKDKLQKLKSKNKGNIPLSKAVDKLIKDIEAAKWKNKDELKDDRPDADQVHPDGFYFFDIKIHRAMVMLEFEEEGEASVIWAGTHQEYERIFKNNRNTIKKYLTDKGLIND